MTRTPNVITTAIITVKVMNVGITTEKAMTADSIMARDTSVGIITEKISIAVTRRVTRDAAAITGSKQEICSTVELIDKFLFS